MVAAGGRLNTFRMFLNDPDFCEFRCPVCTRARRGNRLARILQRIEMFLTCGGCPAGRARRRKFGVGPDEEVAAAPPESGDPRRS